MYEEAVDTDRRSINLDNNFFENNESDTFSSVCREKFELTPNMTFFAQIDILTNCNVLESSEEQQK